MKQTQKTMALWAVIGLLLLSAFLLFESPRPSSESITFNKLLEAAQQQNIEKLVIQENEYSGKFKDGKAFFTVGPLYITEEISKQLHASNAQVEYKKPKGTPFWQQILVYLPVLLIVLLFVYMFRSIQVGGGKALSFGKSKAHLLTENSRKVTFNDVAGIEESKEELFEIIDFLKDPKKFTKLGARIPKGVLLMGSPGTGKTLLARAIAGEANVPFYSISGSDFVEMFVGVGASRVRDLFEQGKKNAPCIIFIDEIDAVGRHRGSGLGGGHDEREQTLNQLLVEMDGFESNEGVIIIAATNRPDVLDPALLRPGRFDRRVVVPTPDVKGREAILKIHVRKVPLADDVELMTLARGTPGFCGADMENLVNEAALYAARQGKKVVSMRDLEMAKDKILMGAERKSMMLTGEEKRVTAYHEAGHALVGILTPGTDPIHKVTIIPRGQALGVTVHLPEKDSYTHSKTYAEGQIAVLMGGRCAEEIIFNQITTGASNDIERATSLAKKMVCKWGMSEKLGPLAFGKTEEQVFLGKDFGQQKDYSESTAIAIDEEVKRIVMQNYQRAKQILLENRDKLEALAQALIEFEILDSLQIHQVLRGETVTLDPYQTADVQKRSAQKEEDKSLRGPSILTPGPQSV